MKIGITIPTLNVSGGVKCLLKTSELLRQRGHEVYLYWQAYSFKNYVKHKLFAPTINWTDSKHTLIALKSWSDIPNHLDKVIASSWRTAAAVCDWSKRTSKQGLYYIQHDESIWDGGDKAAATYTLPLDKIVISTWLQQIMEDSYKQKSLKLITPVDSALFDTVSENPDRRNRVLILHHNFEWKGFEEGLKAFEKVKKDIPHIKLVVLGGREPLPELPAHVEYHFKPNTRALRELYASCGTFLCPSWHEGLGMPSMEAMATGSLLVTTDTGGSRDFAIHGSTAFVSSPKDTDTLSDNLTMALMQWPSLVKMREDGRQKITTFNWDQNIANLELLMNVENKQ